MKHIIELNEAEVSIEEINKKKRKIVVKLKDDTIFMPFSSCETTYPIALIEKILEIKGPAWLCDEIMRDEEPKYVEQHLLYDIFGYIEKEQFKDKKILDFGCGSAGSTMVLSRMLPDTQITGVELEPKLLEVAQLRVNHYKVNDRVKLLLSPDGDKLPVDIGDFDFIFLNAVYEHLLPQERQTILPLLWKHLKPDGILFLNETPYRFFPVETHTTGLILINYLPKTLALYYARIFSKRNLKEASWDTMLRRGIRGGSDREITKILNKTESSAIVLTPKQLGLKDRVDVWYAMLNKTRYLTMKKSLFYLFKLVKVSTGQVIVPILSLAIKKTDIVRKVYKRV